MHIIQAIILGAVQGITEFLPVSSTAHLIITEKLFGLNQATYGLSFDMFINLGTIAAVLIFFWSDLRDIFGRLRLPSGAKPLAAKEQMPWLILGATVPVGLLGMLLQKRIETQFRSLSYIAASLVIVGILMIVAEVITWRRDHNVEPTPLQIVATALSQCLAFVPGVSRSGITITTGLFLGMDRVTAARYSFLLSVPITIAATGKKLLDFVSLIHSQGIAADVLAFYLVGAVVSFITGYFTLKFLLRFYTRYSLTSFAYYRFALALVLLILIARFGY
ncbi:MAG: undecaprenyl-diphosphate phosphatase [bacterium]